MNDVIVETVVICDPAPVAMEGLRSLLASMGGPRVVAMETKLEDAVEAIRDLHPDVLVVDKSYGSPILTEWLRLLRSSGHCLAVVVWGTPISEPEALRFFQAGAAGIVRKSANLCDVWACVRTVVTGGTWMEHELLRDPGRLICSGHSALTAREIQVMDLVERGFRNKEIADALGICTVTVKIHLKHIFEKTGIHGRYGLAMSGLRNKNQERSEIIEQASSPGRSARCGSHPKSAA
jgi:DNA-binding NarL/FixJ family response regulator